VSRKVEQIFLVTYRYDLANLIVCLESIRYWYPDIPITVVKNRNEGDFPIDFLAGHFKLSVIDSPAARYGSYFGSLEPYLTGRSGRFLVMDTDTALTGPVLDFLGSLSADFVVDLEEQPEHKLRALYWNPDGIKDYIPEYSRAWFTFNNGAVCGTGDKVTRADFADFMNWPDGAEPSMKDSSVFPMADMTAINVAINRKAVRGEITVDRVALMIYAPFYMESQSDLVRRIADRSGPELRIIHWADQKHLPIAKRPLGQVYQFYRSRFFSRLRVARRLAILARLGYLDLERYARGLTRRVVGRVARGVGAGGRLAGAP
jgi:hypothetical protein